MTIIGEAPTAIAPSYDSFPCINPSCADYNERGRGNMMLYARYGSREQRRLLICKTCGKTRSERHGSVYWDSRMMDEEIGLLLITLAHGEGIRASARRCRVSKNTIKCHLLRAMVSPNEAWDMIVAMKSALATGTFTPPLSYGPRPATVSRGEFDDFLTRQAERITAARDGLNPPRNEYMAAAIGLIAMRPTAKHTGKLHGATA